MEQHSKKSIENKMADAKPRGRERNREGEGNNKPRAKVESRRQMAATQSFFEKDMTVSTAPPTFNALRTNKKRTRTLLK